MLRANTVFVVGAGASTDVRFPTSDQLKTTIRNKIPTGLGRDMLPNGERKIWQAYKWHAAPDGTQGVDISSYLAAGAQIASAMPQVSSIDLYIDNRRENKFIEICGKVAITNFILEAERKSRLYIDLRDANTQFDFNKIEQTWYAKLWKLLVVGIETKTVDQIFKNVSFVVFNYDRCIEHYLFRALQNHYRTSEQDAVAIMQDLKIYHPYGKVGSLPWQNESMPTKFGEDVRPTELATLAGRIKTYTQRVKDKRTMESLHELMQEAERVVFLGFAFHEQNMELITPNHPTKTMKVFATTQGISESDLEHVKQDIAKLLGLQSHPPYLGIDLGNERLSCTQLFDEYRIAFSRSH